MKPVRFIQGVGPGARLSEPQQGRAPGGGGLVVIWLKRMSVILWLVAEPVTGQTTSPPIPTPTFHEHVAPILYTHCAPCHRPGQSAPFSLLGFADAKKHATDLADVTRRRYMPPWLPESHGEFEGERRLTEPQIAVFQQWAAGGAPEGDPAKAPPAPVFGSDWQLGQPDLVVKMPAPYTVPAEGRDVYRHFVLPLPLDRPRHVRAWEFRPHSRTVHHLFLRVDASGEARRRDATDAEPGFPGMDTPAGIAPPSGHFASWQPGAAPRRNPPGLPWTLHPGQDLVIQMHLQTTGKPEPLQSEVAFYFTDQAPTNQPQKIGLVSYAIDLAPGASNVVVTEQFTLPADADLMGLLPHTHYLGRRLEALAHPPGGDARRLLLIPDWDFNWQGDYLFREPVFLPAGTRVEMRFTFDNTAGNPRNPFSPPRRARFGLNTTDEMAELWLQLLPRTPEGAVKFTQANLERTSRDIIAYNQERLRMDPRDGQAHVSLGRALLAQRRTDEARRHFEQAVAVAPQFDEAHYYLGLIHRVGGNPQAAAGAFVRALELNPSHTRAHGNLGLMYLGVGRLDKAATHLAEAVRLDPSDALAHSALGEIRAREGRLEEAEKLLARAVELNPQDEASIRNLAAVRQRRRAGN